MTKVEITVSVDDIERILQCWERKNPGKISERDLMSKDFAYLMLEDMISRARLINPPEKKT